MNVIYDIPRWAKAGNVAIGLCAMACFLVIAIGWIVMRATGAMFGKQLYESGWGGLVFFFLLKTFWLWVQEVARIIWGW